MRSERYSLVLRMRPFAWSRIVDRRNHHPEPRLRAVDGPALRPDRGGACADLRTDGRGQLRPWRVPDDRDVRDLLPVRVFRARSVTGGAAGRGRIVRVR